MQGIGYIFPKRPLRSTDVLDPVEFDADVIPAAEKYSGRLNAHAFRTTLKTAPIAVGAGAYFRNPTATLTPCNHGLSLSLRPSPAPTPALSTRINNDGGWQAITSMTRALTTGNGKVWVLAYLQYFVQEWGDGSGGGDVGARWATPFVFGFSPANVQFGIRIDGSVWLPGRTGTANFNERPFWPIKANDERGVGQHGPTQPTSGQAHALGPIASPVRLGGFFDVSAGPHLIEVVARRVMDIDSDRRTTYNSDNYVVVYGRQMLSLELPSTPLSALSGSSVSASAWEPEDSFSAAAIGTNRVNAVRSAYNSVAEGAVARGAFRNVHLPSAVLQYRAISADRGASAYTDNFYPGYGSDVLAAAKTTDTGWWELDTGNGGVASGTAQLRATPVVGANWAGNSGLLVVLANVQVRSLREFDNAAAAVDNPLDGIFGFLAIGWHRDGDPPGTVTVEETSEAVVCNDNKYDDDGAANIVSGMPFERDIPLMYVRDLSVSPLDPMNYISVYGSTLPGRVAPAYRTQMTWQRGSMQVLRLRI